MSCIMEAINVEQLRKEFKAASRNGRSDLIFNKACNAINSTFPCLDSYMEGIDICMDEDDKKMFKIFELIAHAALDSFCSRSFNDMEEIEKAKSDSCILSQLMEVPECAKISISKYFNHNEGVHKQTEEIVKLFNENCEELVTFKTCVIPLFEPCNNKVPVEIFNDILKRIIDHTPCKYLNY